MEKTNYTKTILVDQSADKVFAAINNVRGWWSKEIVGETDRLDAVWDYHYQDVHRCKMKITELVPNRRVLWQVLDNYFSFTESKQEWLGNEMIFEITEQGGQTQLRFTQVGLDSGDECYDICSNAWDTYIGKSLYKLITEGKGEPNGSEQARTEAEKALGNPGFSTTFFTDESPEKVFDAISHPRNWWQGEITGEADESGAEFSYEMKGHHFSRQKVVTFLPNEKIEWLVTDSKLNGFEDATEWTGTTIRFDISEINNKTQVRFTHDGLHPGLDCYGSCSDAWEKLIMDSLVSFIRTGAGIKVFG